MIKVPCKITLTGDKDYARIFIGAAQSQLRILEGELIFQDIKQGVRRRRLDPRTTVEATIVNQFQEVKIYSEPLEKAEEGIEEIGVAGRFFAKVRRGGLYGEVKFYWIIFTEDGDIKITSAGSSRNLLNRMSATPYTVTRNTHSFTKSFMIENESGNDERWIAAPHLLIKERWIDDEKTYTEIFNPLGYPNAQSNLTGGEFRTYPLPPLCGDGSIQHPCPPNRFYCNVDERKMAWYSCYTVLDETIPTAPVLVHYCFGIILTLTDNMISETYYSPMGTEYHRIVDPGTDKELVKTFNCYSSEADGEGFTPLWYYKKPDPVCTPPDPDPMCGADADVPYQMLTDVNSLDEETLEVFIPWDERPLKITVDLTGPNVGTTESDHTLEQVESTLHWHWTEDGFGQEECCNLEQEKHDTGEVEYSQNIVVSHEHSGCNCPDEMASSIAEQKIKAAICCCTGCGATKDYGKLEETLSAQWQRRFWRSPVHDKDHLHTKYEIKIFDEIEEMESWDYEAVTVQGKMGEAKQCLGRWVFDHVEGHTTWFKMTCTGPHSAPEVAPIIRYIGETLQQKLVDSVDAEWGSPNVAFVGAKKDRTYTNAFREEGRYSRSTATISGAEVTYLGSPAFGLLDDASSFGSCFLGNQYRGDCGYPSAGCFMEYIDPEILWGSGVGSSEFALHTSITDYGGFDPFAAGRISSNYHLKDYGTANSLDEPLLLQYRVDGEGSFSSQLFNRTYYLDDRSTNDSEGLLVAARGAIAADYTIEGYPVFDVARWGVIYKAKDEDFTEITDKLLKALDCNKTELIELGLV
jgi:hypothetical protein